MYCRQCGYNLRGLERESCPECGGEFRRDDPATYAKSPLWPAWIHGIGWLALLYIVPICIAIVAALILGLLGCFNFGFHVAG